MIHHFSSSLSSHWRVPNYDEYIPFLWEHFLSGLTSQIFWGNCCRSLRKISSFRDSRPPQITHWGQIILRYPELDPDGTYPRANNSIKSDQDLNLTRFFSRFLWFLGFFSRFLGFLEFFQDFSKIFGIFEIFFEIFGIFEIFLRF